MGKTEGGGAVHGIVEELIMNIMAESHGQCCQPPPAASSQQAQDLLDRQIKKIAVARQNSRQSTTSRRTDRHA